MGVERTSKGDVFGSFLRGCFVFLMVLASLTSFTFLKLFLSLPNLSHRRKISIFSKQKQKKHKRSFFDAGSCIDGRLTSAWNWCSKIEKKSFYNLFKVAGFAGFDGKDWSE